MEALFKMCLYLVFLSTVLGELEPQNLGAQCSCPVKHPQEKICRADLAIQARIIGVEPIETGPTGMGGLLEYTVKPTKVYKGSESMIERGRRIKMITSRSPGKCGVTEMKTGELYILTGVVLGGEVFFSLCEWVQPFRELTVDQRGGLRAGYANGCDSCLITQENSIPGIHDEPPSLPENVCFHDPLGSAHLHIEDCESIFSTCQVTDENQCAWVPSKRYDRCVAKRLRRHLAQQARTLRKAAGHKKNKINSLIEDMPSDTAV